MNFKRLSIMTVTASAAVLSFGAASFAAGNGNGNGNGASVDIVCQEASAHQTGSGTYPWGTATALSNGIQVTVDSGFAVTFCVKGGPGRADHSEVTGPVTRIFLTPDNPNSGSPYGLSHWAYTSRTVTTTTQPGDTTTTEPGDTTTTEPGDTTTTEPGDTTTTEPDTESGPPTTASGSGAPPGTNPAAPVTSAPAVATPVPAQSLPRTGTSNWVLAAFATALLGAGFGLRTVGRES